MSATTVPQETAARDAAGAPAAPTAPTAPAAPTVPAAAAPARPDAHHRHLPFPASIEPNAALLFLF